MKKYIFILIMSGVINSCLSSITPSAITETATITAPATSIPSTPIPPSPIATLIPDVSFMNRPDGDSIRVLNFNVLWDSIFPNDDPNNHAWRSANKVDAFRRIIKAIDPDVVCLQEINSLREPIEISTIFDEAIPLLDDNWNAVIERDTVIVSRFELLSKGYDLPNLNQSAALINLPDQKFGDVDLYMICSHFKSSGALGDILQRQRQADTLVSQIGDFQTVGDHIDLPFGTPFILLGDFNVYDTDPHYQLTTMLTGDIVNEDMYGMDVIPDWDGTDLTDALPSHNGRGQLTYTWRDDTSGFNPYPLDRIIYSDSVLVIVNQFILDTMSLTPIELELLSLFFDDVVINAETGVYDHLPMVVDFVLVTQ